VGRAIQIAESCRLRCAASFSFFFEFFIQACGLIQNPPKMKNPNCRWDLHDFAIWRRERDSNPRMLSHQQFFSAQPRPQSTIGYKIKNPARSRIKRRERDSNPRMLSHQQFSRLPQSTTLPSLRGENTALARVDTNIFSGKHAAAA
jgi:hypothetical protein